MASEAENLRRFLLARLPWLERQCARRARTLPGVDPADLLQASIEEFLERAPRWFEGESRDPEARAMTLLMACLRHQVTTALRQGKRTGELQGADEPDVDGFQGIPDREAGPEQAAIGREVERAVETGTLASRRVAVLSIDLPGLLTRDDLVQASGDAGKFLTARPIDDAWQEFEAMRSDARRLADDVTWSRDLAWLYYVPGPRDQASRRELDMAVESLTRMARRGREDLAKRWSR